MKERKIVTWVKTHKGYLAIVAGVAACGIIAYMCSRCIRFDGPEIPEVGVGKTFRFWKGTMRHKKVIDLGVCELTVADLGAYGEGLVKALDEVTPESTVTAVLEITEK